VILVVLMAACGALIFSSRKHAAGELARRPGGPFTRVGEKI
jgi:hypothetical protein